MEVKDIIEKQKNAMNNDWKNAVINEKENTLQRYLWSLMLETWNSLLSTNISGKTLLIICAWSWYDADFWHKKWAIVTATDLSEIACEKIKERNSSINVKIENAESLSYNDNSFDYVIVRAWLHHLPRPILWIYEMLRVAKKWILFMEAQDSMVMRILRKSWLVLEIEPSWNYVYTFTRREIYKLCRSMFLNKPQIKTYFYQYIPYLSNKIYPKLSWMIWLTIYKILLNIFNFLFWYWWNNFICYVDKKNK
ncbi:MAG: Methyltransferase protein [uncultured bacterium (gcode 4)]|uniref:Methyltransferase protein n=1 Tax=uncultured bacterium (gcode 4) TaxID=1234023 RepID=K2F549_9BACT|nr:MAG: Methyltransferase protein [uncultured bacterium (gcode 4)]